MAKTVTVIGLEGFPIVKRGDNLAEVIVETANKNYISLNDGDIVVIAQKIVSKAEARVVTLRSVVPSTRAKEMAKVTLKDPKLVELILRETEEIVKASAEILIVQNKRGLICINAGIDKSNVEGRDAYALLPEDPDASAQRIRSEIREVTGKEIAVVISDTYSRPFRRGQVEFAIGIAGLEPFKDYRGQQDLFDYVMKVKYTAVADEIASAAELVTGQGKEGIPVVIIKGLSGIECGENASSSDLSISQNEDLFKNTL